MSMVRRVDALIVTALKLEFEQVLQVEDEDDEASWTEERGPLGLDVAFRTFRGANGEPLHVAVTWATDMGMVAAANAAIPLMEKYQPRCIAMSGVCAGRPNKVELGDVIVADRLWTYDAGKLVREKDDEGKEVERFQGDVLTFNLPADWKHRAERFPIDPAWKWLADRPVPYLEQERWVLGLALENTLTPQHAERKTRCPDWKDVIQRLWDRGMLTRNALTLTPKGKKHIESDLLLHPDGFGERKPFAVHVGPVGTGNKVVEDPSIWGRLSESERKVLGLEMEACAIGAIAHAAQVGRNVRAIVMKGVMDVANPERDDRYKRFAARASAEVLLRFLRAHLEPEGGRSEREAASSTKASSEAPAEAAEGATDAGAAASRPPAASVAVEKGPIHVAVRRSERELLGRDTLLGEVRRALDDDASRGVVLHGMTGVGKTSMAEVIGSTDHERGHYPGGVFEVAGNNESTFLSGLAGLASALGTPEGVSEEQRLGVARKRLAQATQRTLLVIDDLDAVAPWVERELRALPKCVRVLATLTHWPIGFLHGPGRAHWIEVPGLAPEGALALVKALAPDLGDAEVAKLNEFFEGHTLGLEVAARTLASDPMLGVGGYLELIKSRPDEVPEAVNAQERTALRALRVLWARLPEAAQRAWAVCGAFGDAPIPDGWLRLALADAGMREADARSGLGELLKRYLVIRIAEGSENSLRLHPIVRAFSRSLTGDEDRRAMAMGITRWFDGTWDSEAGLHQKARLALPHVDIALKNSEGDLRVARRLAVALRMNRYQENQQRAIGMLRGVLQTHSGRADEVEAAEWVQQELARLLFDQGTRDQLVEAETLLRETLRLRERRAAAGTALAVSLNDLSRVLRANGGLENLEESKGLLRRALQEAEALPPGNGVGVATLLSNLSGVLKDLGGRERLEEAERLLRRALRIEEASLGPDAPTVAIALNNLSVVLSDLGGRERLEEAERLVRRALRIEEAALGPDAPTLAGTLNNLSAVLTDLGGRELPNEPERLLRRALRLEEAALGPDAPTIAVRLSNLSVVLGGLGGRERLDEAERLLRRALLIDRRAFPGGSQRTAGFMHNLSQTLRKLGGQARLREAQHLESAARKSSPSKAAPKRRR